MKKLGRIQTLAVAGLSALAVAAPVAIAQTVSAEQGQQQQGAHAGRHGRGGEFGGRHGRRGGDHFGGFMFRGVELSDAQKASLKQLHQGFGERTKSLREQLRAKHEELRQAESNGTFNEALAAQKLAELAPIQAKLMAEQFKLRQDSLAVLTPEQKAQMEQRRAEFKAKREQFKARRGEQTQQQ
jgi:periplasmic protein CpxP/Spy